VSFSPNILNLNTIILLVINKINNIKKKNKNKVNSIQTYNLLYISNNTY
jgi:hypothetical protein